MTSDFVNHGAISKASNHPTYCHPTYCGLFSVATRTSRDVFTVTAMLENDEGSQGDGNEPA